MIDLRSDTVTVPSEQMLETIKVSSLKDVFFDVDSTTRALEDRCAKKFGFEDAMFVVSGTMANQVAIKTHTTSGDEVLIDQSYHIHYYESGATAIISGVHLQAIHTTDGIITPDSVEAVLASRTRSVYGNKIKLLCLENSINYHSGKIFAFDKLKNISLFARSQGWRVHLDGARIFNAIAKEKVHPKLYGDIADSMMISLNKGLGVPFGAILMGSKSFIKNARIYNKWFGGGLHQSGLLAGMGLYAIDHNVSRIEDDNDNATLLALLINKANIQNLHIPSVETNIVILDLSKLKIPALELISLLSTKGIMLHEWSEYRARAVTNLNVSDEDVTSGAREIISAIKVLVDQNKLNQRKL